MKITKLNLVKYGHFQDYELDLGHESGVNIIYGENGSGKSTSHDAILRALFGMLTGNAKGNKYDQLFGSKRQIDITIETDKEALQFSRTPARKFGGIRTTAGAEDSALESKVLAITAGYTTELFQHQHGLSAKTMRAGSKQLLEGDAENASVHAIAAGITPVKELVKQLEADMNSMLAARSGTIRDAVNAIKAAEKDAKQNEKLQREFETINTRLEQLDEQISLLRGAEDKRESELRTLTNIRESRARIVQHCELQQQLDEMPATPEAWGKNSALLLDKHDELSAEIAQRKSAVESAQLALEAAIKQHPLSAPEMSVEQLIEAANAERQKLADVFLPSLDAAKKLEDIDLIDRTKQHDIARDELDTRAARLRSGMDVDAVLALAVPGDAELSAYEEKLGEAAKLIDNQRQSITKIQSDLENTAKQLRALVVEDAVPSKDELQRLRSDRNEQFELVAKAALNQAEVSDKSGAIERYKHTRLEADNYADQVIASGENVGKRSALELRSAELELELERHSEALHAAEQQQGDLIERGRELCKKTFGFVPSDEVKQIRAFMADIAAIRREAEELQRAKMESDSLATRIRQAETNLRSELELDAEDQSSLSSLIQRGERLKQKKDEESELLLEANSRVKDAANSQRQTQVDFEEKQQLRQITAAQLLEQAEVQEIAEVRVVAQRAAQRDQLAERRNELTNAITEATKLSVGEVLEIHRRFADATELELAITTLADQIREAKPELETLNAERDKFVEEKGLVEDKQNSMQATAQRRDAIAQLEQLIPRYQSLALQHHMLKQFLEHESAADTEPLMQQASANLATITDGEWVRIEARENDKGAYEHYAIRSADSTEEGTKIELLSEGERDAVYLALRLAYLKLQSQSRDILPLIVDDVFTALDDSRAAGAFRVLEDLAKTVQVIFLTHHEHMLEIAEAAIPACGVVRLSGTNSMEKVAT